MPQQQKVRRPRPGSQMTPDSFFANPRSITEWEHHLSEATDAQIRKWVKLNLTVWRQVMTQAEFIQRGFR